MRLKLNGDVMMAQRTRSEYTLLNMVSGFAGYAVNFLVGIFSRMVFTRVFTADYLGVTGLFTNVLNMLSLVDLGIGPAIVYALYKPLAEKDESKIASLVSFYGKCYRAIAAVVLVIGLALLPFLNVIIKEPPDIKEDIRILYMIALLNTVSGYLFAYRNSLLQAAQRTYIVTLVSNTVIVVQNIVQIILMLSVGEYIIYTLVVAFFNIVTNLILAVIATRQYPCIKTKKPAPIEKEEKRSLIRNVRALTISKIGGLLINSTDNIIITYFSGLASVGFVSNYSLISTSVANIFQIVFNSVNASVGNHNALESKANRYKLFKAINLANFWAYAWSGTMYIVLSSDLVALLFGENYLLPIGVLSVLALNAYIVGMQNAVWTYINTQGLFRHGRYLVLLTAAINLFVSIWLGNLFGLIGVFLGTTFARVFTNVWYSPYALFKYGFGMPVRQYYIRYLGFLALFILTGGLCLFIASFVSVSSLFVRIIIKAVICLTVPNLIFLILFGRTESFAILFDFVKGFAQKFLGKFIKKKS